MGCDIHAYVESKEYDTYWTQANPHLSRNYRMFGLMVGVRQPEIALYESRGIPHSSYYETKQAYLDMKPDAHHPSYLSTNEFEKILAEYDRIEDENWGTCPGIYKATLAFMRELEDARIVFWFDN